VPQAALELQGLARLHALEEEEEDEEEEGDITAS